MIKIAHEAPIAFMNSMRQLTDYDYALACLFGKIPGYYEYFEIALKEGRHVLLDNGLFEDGVPMEAVRYAGWIEKLKPTEYIVPDEFDKREVTIQHFEKWNERFADLPGKKIGVCQGTTFHELDQCFAYFSQFADKIAINFASVAYQNHAKDNGFGPQWDANAVYGRVSYLSQLFANKSLMGVAHKTIPYHILGCSLPIEFKFLRETKVNNKRLIDYFDTMDTSAPVVWGLLNGLYPDDLGSIVKKNKTKLKDLIETNPTPEQCSNIGFNAAKFRQYLI